MEKGSFGNIELTNSSEIIFFVDTFKGNEYANIRKFIKTTRYTGPTRQGVKLNKNQLETVIKSLRNIQQDIHSIEKQEILCIPGYQGKCIKVNIDFFRGEYWIDFRIYYETESFTGPTKRGIKIPFNYFKVMVHYLEEMHNYINDISIIEKDENQEKERKDNVIDKKIEGVPDEYKEYFE